MKNIAIVVPPENEQKKITDYLQKKLENYEKVNNDLEKSIETLQEFKFSLISNVVTGKIKI